MAIQTQVPNLEELIANSDTPILAVFEAHWCGPSHLIDSILEQVSSQLQQQLQVVKIDNDQHPDWATRYQVHPLPALLLFHKGQLVGRIDEEHTENLMPASRLIQRLESLLSAPLQAQ